MSLDELLEADLLRIDSAVGSDLSLLVNSKVLITGATGFVGTWLVNSWLYSRALRGGLGTLTILARSFSEDLKLIAEKSPQVLRLITSDIRGIDPNDLRDVEFVVHAATPARESLNLSSPSEMISIIVDGQRAILSACDHHSLKGLLFLSSGAVYGRQPVDLDFLQEGYTGAPRTTDPRNAYHESKRFAELLGAVWASETNLRFVIARLFAFIGPYLPMDQHFAAGNFIGDVLQGIAPRLKSQGTSIRSYQYASDMTAWLWALLSRGQSGEAYNVGSMDSITIRHLAEQVLQISELVSQQLQTDPTATKDFSRYVPDTTKIERELKVTNSVSLTESIENTISWGRRASPIK